jgi:hypothetical protein
MLVFQEISIYHLYVKYQNIENYCKRGYQTEKSYFAA